jgi:hypothetical protein
MDTYSSFFEYLYKETAARPSLRYYLVDVMINEMDEGYRAFCFLRWLMEESLIHTCLYCEYLKETVDLIISIPQLKQFHDQTWKMYTIYADYEKSIPDPKDDYGYREKHQWGIMEEFRNKLEANGIRVD